MAMPDELNGYPVVKKRNHGNGYSTVMVHMGGDNAFTPYCVATWFPSLGSQWQWGHYCRDREEADDAFADVSGRNEARYRA